MITTITLNLTKEQLEMILVATTRLLTYSTDQKARGNDYAADAIPQVVEINNQIVRRLQILRGETIYNHHPNLAPDPPR